MAHGSQSVINGLTCRGVWYAVIRVNRELYPSVREVIRNDKTGVWD